MRVRIRARACRMLVGQLVRIGIGQLVRIGIGQREQLGLQHVSGVIASSFLRSCQLISGKPANGHAQSLVGR